MKKVTFKPHIIEQLKTHMLRQLFCVNWVNLYLTITRLALIKRYVLPQLKYCRKVELIFGISVGRLEISYGYYILRTVLGYSKSLTYDFSLDLAQMQSLHVRKQFQSLVISPKFLHGNRLEYLTELFTAAERSNLRGSGTRLQLPSFNLEYMHD